MNGDQGFVDLRLNRQEGQTEEGFWPSFTDIMTVIVMIFMLAMVILLIRNMELVQQLRSTVQAQQKAAEFAQIMGQEKDSVSDKLSRAYQQMKQLQTRVASLEAQREEQEAAISSQRHQITRHTRELDTLNIQNTQMNRENADLAQRLRSSQTDLDSLKDRELTLLQDVRNLAQQNRLTDTELADTRRTLAELRQAHEQLDLNRNELAARSETLDRELAESRSQLISSKNRLAVSLQEQQRTLQELQEQRQDYANLRLDHAQSLEQSDLSQREAEQLRTRLAVQEQALTNALAALEASDTDLNELRQNYGNLQLEYADLVKPARSREGRYLVEVQITKRTGKERIRLRSSRSGEYQRVSRDQLDARLSLLKQQHKEGLYIRVVIPEDSGLSYNEAWGFTTQLHSAYDYYYQKGARGE